MAVSSIKGCWSKLSARIRDYIDVVDSYYRPSDEIDGSHVNGGGAGDHLNHVVVGHRPGHKCGRRDCLMGSLVQLTASHKSSNKPERHHQSTKLNADHRHRHHHHHHEHQNHSVNHPERTSARANSCGQQRNNEANGLVVSPTSRKQNCLSLGFTKRKTAQGQVYFVDLNGHKYWHDPSVPKELLYASLDLDSLVGGLPNNWEVGQTSSGRKYFINHTKQTTQFTDPRLVAFKDQLVRHLRRLATIQQNEVSSTVSNNNTTETTVSQHANPSSRASRQINLMNYQDYLARSQLQQQQQNATSNNTSATTARSTPRRSNPNSSSVSNDDSNTNNLMTGTLDNRTSNHYQKNLLRGSHNNLSNPAMASSGQSNTFTGPVPTWFKPLVMNNVSRKNLVANSSSNNNNNNRTQNTAQSIPDANNSTTINSSRVGHQRLDVLDSSTNNNNSQQYYPVTSPHNQSSLPPFGPYHSRSQQNSETSNQSKELFDKISILRQELLKQQVLSHPCRIDIHRKRIFEESFRAVSQMQPRDLKKRLLVKFRGEEGLDYGGVAREWFYLLSREILNPVHGLFQYTSDDIYNLQINPDSGIVYREHLSYLNFCGRIIGMAVFHGHFIEGHFTLPFYKMLLKKSITLEDIEFVDPELHRSLCWILENDITDVIDTTFLVQHNAFGQLQEHELKEGGRNIVVTEDNKHDYVSLYVNYRCRRGIESQFEALQRGFYELISPNLVEKFDERELELLIGGLSKINIEDWRLHTKLKNCTVETPLVNWFWDIVKSYDEDRRARLLQFVTGSPRVPIQGFKALQGVNSELRLFTIHLIRNASTDDLPKSHTCFNRIDLPSYETYDKLRDKLTQAIEETMGFAMQ